MSRIALLSTVIVIAALSHDVQAQSYWYAPPGFDDGYYYGLDFGPGVGYGYGIGVGVAVSPQMLMSSVTPAYIPPQDFGDSYLDSVPGPTMTRSKTGYPVKAKKVVQNAKKTKVIKPHGQT